MKQVHWPALNRCLWYSSYRILQYFQSIQTTTFLEEGSPSDPRCDERNNKVLKDQEKSHEQSGRHCFVNQLWSSCCSGLVIKICPATTSSCAQEGGHLHTTAPETSLKLIEYAKTALAPLPNDIEPVSRLHDMHNMRLKTGNNLFGT